MNSLSLPSRVTGSLSTFDAVQNHPIANPPEFIRACRRRLGPPVSITHAPKARTYRFACGAAGFDWVTVTVHR